MALQPSDKSPSAAAAAADDDLPPPPRRRDRRDDRDSDRPPARRDFGGAGRGSSPQRDRDRDFKRRRSPGGSPPPPYRDRRHSSPPPPFKRPRRGSPRGPEDRFGHGYNGGYERGVGGRSYGDEKPRGRFMNRSAGGYQHGPVDLGFNRGGYADSSNRGNLQREGLMSYKQFMQELEDDILPAEAERRYQEYRTEFIATQKRSFFDAHKDEEWLKNKYHPSNLLAVIERRNEHARQVAKDFILDLRSGTLDLNASLTAPSSSKEGKPGEPNSDDEADATGKRKRHDKGRPEDSAAPKAHPVSCEPVRIEADIKQALAIVQKLDNEKKIEDNVLSNVEYSKKENDKTRGGSMGPIVIIRGLTSVKGLEGTELLDTVLTYLWRVHGVDYYGAIEANDAKGLRHVRPEGRSRDEAKETRAEWEKKIDSFWKERLGGQDPLELMTAKEKIETVAAEALDPYVRKIRDEKYGWKYGCGAKGCTKLFHASEFVTKHLKLKHPELVVDVTTKLREDIYFQNYMNDSDAPGGKPVMQQPQNNQQKRRLPMENRLRDDRGHRRENERIDGSNDGNRMGNMENSPSRDQQSKGGGLEMGSHDESGYDDAYGGQGISAYGSDMPPILMPVPGAGPLGPFVPAPPEVAMQMMRDQGGSYDGGGRIIRPGPHIGGPTPIIAVPPALRQDPRRMRSYQDLDAPEDEVTVIDYRSL